MHFTQSQPGKSVDFIILVNYNGRPMQSKTVSKLSPIKCEIVRILMSETCSKYLNISHILFDSVL